MQPAFLSHLLHKKIGQIQKIGLGCSLLIQSRIRFALLKKKSGWADLGIDCALAAQSVLRAADGRQALPEKLS
jgi:hypothetical protein